MLGQLLAAETRWFGKCLSVFFTNGELLLPKNILDLAVLTDDSAKDEPTVKICYILKLHFWLIFFLFVFLD